MPLCVDDTERKRMSYTLTETATATKQVEAHGRPVALLRPLIVRKLVALLRPLPACERATILAQAVREGIMTRVGADQVRIALVLDDNDLSALVTRAQHCALSRPASAAAPSTNRARSLVSDLFPLVGRGSVTANN